jgi:hypothetical protein
LLTSKDFVVPLVALGCIIVLLITGPIPQNQEYHQFADSRTFFGIPNFLNVITNLPFGITGFLGLLELKNLKNKELKHIILFLFTGFMLLMPGSSYYHLFPNNNALIYDRIPISIIVMSFLTFIIYKSIYRRTVFNTLIILNTIGIMSVTYWVITEYFGKGDLRWYGFVQFFPIIAIPLILYLYRPSFNLSKETIFILLLFGVAKMMEKYDKEVFKLLEHTVSGHSLKHLFMSVAGYQIVLLIREGIKE